MQSAQSRRRFLATLSSATVASLMGSLNSLAQEAPPETTMLRLPRFSTTICGAPAYVAQELLRTEGFTDIRYVPTESGATGAQLAARGDVDFENAFTGSLVNLIDAGQPITMVGGLHIGCYELFAHEGIHSIRDVKGKTVGVQHFGSSPQLLVSSMAAYVGLDPVKDIHWVVSSAVPMKLFADGKIDAFLGFPPEPQELRARKVGHVVLLGGVHVGCFELFGTERIRAIRDLKGKTVAVPEPGSAHYVFLASMAAHVGLDPRKDINWVLHPPSA